MTLTTQMGGYACRLAPLAARLSALAATDTGIQAPAWQDLNTAAAWLSYAAGCAPAFTWSRTRPTGRHILDAIPSNLIPPRHVPAGRESVPELCPGAAIADAADAARDTRTSWQAVTRTWDTLTTGPAPDLSPVAAELGDLVLWIGRIARTSPDWTPARADASPPRTPAALARTPAGLLAVAQAIAATATLLTRTASHDRQTIELLAGERGLYIPARLAPDQRASAPARRYVLAPQARIAETLTAYTTAARHCAHLARSLGSVLTASASPDLIATPELAATATFEARRQLTRAADRPPQADTAARRTGDLQQFLRRIDIHDPALVTQAAIIDHATEQLLAQAATTTQRRQQAYNELSQMHGRLPKASVKYGIGVARQDQPRSPTGLQAQLRAAAPGQSVAVAPHSDVRRSTARSATRSKSR